MSLRQYSRIDVRLWVAVILYALMAMLSAEMGAIVGRPIAFLALLTVPAILYWRDRPVLVGAAIVVGGIWLRAAIAYAAPMTDQIETTQAAWRDVLLGLNPYGHDILGTSTNAPFPYGPLSLIAYIPGAWTEIAAAGATLALLARHRAWVTLAILAACPLTVRGAVMGLNDTLPGLLILLAMLEARRSPVRGAAILALAVAVKPYAAVWLPGLVGLGGFVPAIVFGAVSLVLWLPMLAVWGAGAFLKSIQMAQDIHTEQYAALDLPPLRMLAVPLALVPAAWRSWQASVWFGIAGFMAYLYLARWASLGYLLAILPLAGLAIESFGRRPTEPSIPIEPADPAPQIP